jgi:hypothetical protein
MMRILEALPDRFAVCSQARGGSGHDHDLLQPIAARVTGAHPGRWRLIFGSQDQNDRKDAQRLSLGAAPAVHVPSPDVRTGRERFTGRGRVIAQRTRAKNSRRTRRRCAGVVPPRPPALWTKKGLEWRRRRELPTAAPRRRRDLLLEEIESRTNPVRRLEHQWNPQAGRSLAVARLRSIPGVGARTAAAVAACIDDPHRFEDAKAVGRYCGLVPSQDQSGDRNRLGHIEVRRGGSRRRGMEWERPHTLSGRSAQADDAEGMSGKSRNRLAPVLTEASSWTSDRSARVWWSEHRGR